MSELILPSKYAQNETASLIIRKFAHLLEFAALGFTVMVFVECVKNDYRKKLHSTALFYVLVVAVLDEHIQSFSDRNSSTDDILLDFCGGLIGFFLAWLIALAYRKFKQQYLKNNKIA